MPRVSSRVDIMDGAGASQAAGAGGARRSHRVKGSKRVRTCGQDNIHYDGVWQARWLSKAVGTPMNAARQVQMHTQLSAAWPCKARPTKAGSGIAPVKGWRGGGAPFAAHQRDRNAALAVAGEGRSCHPHRHTGTPGALTAVRRRCHSHAPPRRGARGSVLTPKPHSGPGGRAPCCRRRRGAPTAAVSGTQGGRRGTW